MSTNNNVNAQFLVYFEGELIPYTGLSVTVSSNDFLRFSVIIPADQLMHRFGRDDRVSVTLFFLKDNSKYCFLTEADIIAWGWDGSPQSETMRFECVSSLSTLDFFHLMYVNSSNWFQAHLGTNTIQVPTFTEIQKSLLVDEKNQFIKRPVELLKLIFELVHKAPNTVLAQFFKHYFDRANITQQVAGFPVIEDEGFPILQAFKNSKIFELYSQNNVQTGDSQTFWTFINNLYTYLFYELIHVIAPPFLKSYDYKLGTSGKDCMMTYLTKPQTYFSLPPRCNVIFPSMWVNNSYKEIYQNQPTRVLLYSSRLATMFGGGGASLLGVFDLYEYPKIANLTSKTYFSQPLPEELKRGPLIVPYTAPNWLNFMMKSQLTKTISEVATTASGVSGIADFSVVKVTIFDAYAKYEYFREKYIQRAGSVTVDFNPNIVCNFPCVILNAFNPGLSIYAVVDTVSHTVTESGSIGTTISYKYGRSLIEILEMIAANKGTIIQPEEPIGVMSQIMQKSDEADKIYKALGFGGVFDITQFIDSSNIKEPKFTTYLETILFDKELSFNFINREVTSLEQYISFYNSSSSGIMEVGGINIPTNIRQFRSSFFVPATSSNFVGGGDNIDILTAAIGRFESGSRNKLNKNWQGNYAAIGKNTKYGNALGKYQIMSEFLNEYALKALGYPVSREEFLASPALQDAIAKWHFNYYYSKYGNIADVATAWFAGPGRVGKDNVSLNDGITTVPAYIKGVTAYYNEFAGYQGPVEQQVEVVEESEWVSVVRAYRNKMDLKGFTYGR